MVGPTLADEIHKHDGSILTGKIIEIIPNELYKIQLAGGSILVIKPEEVKEIVISSTKTTGIENWDRKWKKHNLSIGILDDRTGLSLIGYTYNVRLTDMDECFIGGGTAMFAFTGTVGWKHYYRKSRLSISSVLCGFCVVSILNI